jgi:hypothetical protein
LNNGNIREDTLETKVWFHFVNSNSTSWKICDCPFVETDFKRLNKIPSNLNDPNVQPSESVLDIIIKSPLSKEIEELFHDLKKSLTMVRISLDEKKRENVYFSNSFIP